MPNTDKLVINTSPLISLIAALGNLKVLELLYQQVLVPWEVCRELQQGGVSGFAVAEYVTGHHTNAGERYLVK